MTLAVGVDIGTTETKALVLDTVTGQRLGLATQPTRWTGGGGRVETTAEALFTGVLRALTGALDGQPGAVTGLGLAGLAESGVVLDPAGRAHTPVIAWYDQRGRAELGHLDPGFAAAFPGRVGLPLNAQCTFAKLLWLRASAAAFPRRAQWLNIPEYVAHRLGAERVTEPSLAARTGLVDAGSGGPWPDALERVGLDPGFLPPLCPGGRPAGRVDHPDAPAALRGAAVTVVGHDHPVAAVGAGATGPDVLFNSTGTADVLLRSVPRALSDTERAELVAAGYSAGAHVLPGRAALIGTVRAGLVLGRVLDLLGRADHPARLELDRRWRPDLSPSGVRVRGAEQDAPEVVVRLSDGAGPDALWAAALSHVSAVTAALLGEAERRVGPHRDAVAAGGWVRLASVRASKRRVIPGVRFAAIDQPGAFGAALAAAWAGAGCPGAFEEFAERLRPTLTEEAPAW